MGESNINLDTTVLMNSLNSVKESITNDFLIEISPYLVGIFSVALILFLAWQIFCIIKQVFWRWFS